ncbi:MAG: NAD(P)H-hydrate dehydratase [Chloroflexota bacterium]|nr:NAD(P)H-hydrate dehydratase [Chloroflexota bacterium]
MIGARTADDGPADIRVVDVAEMRALEAQAPPGVNLMQNAGQAIAAAILRRAGSQGGKSVVVLVGPGDNGGDVLIAAAHLAAAGARVTAWASRERPDDSLVTAATARGVRWRVWAGNRRPLSRDVRQARCLVDGLLGIGSSPPLRGPIADILASLPRVAGQIRIAVDIPSGIDSDTGAADTASFPAHLTLATGPLKLGALLHPAVEFAGRQIALNIGLPPKTNVPLRSSRIDARTARRLLPARPLDGHKGTFGRLAIVAGSVRYRGAAALATIAALRAGAGLVTLASVEPACAATAALAPAATFVSLPASPMGQPAATATEVAAEVARPTALLLGPGLGRSDASDALVFGLLDTLKDTPTVIDADGLNALADRSDLLETLGPRRILTPHPGELARLLRLASPPEGRNRLAAAKDLAVQTQATIVAKGSPTFVCAGDRVRILARPNPALAAAGSGDVLAGATASLLAQGLEASDAAALGTWLHSRAARIAGGRDDRGVPMEQVAAAIGAAANRRRARRGRRSWRRRHPPWRQSGAP